MNQEIDYFVEELKFQNKIAFEMRSYYGDRRAANVNAAANILVHFLKLFKNNELEIDAVLKQIKKQTIGGA